MISTAVITHPPAPFSAHVAHYQPPPGVEAIRSAMGGRLQTVIAELQSKRTLLINMI